MKLYKTHLKEMKATLCLHLRGKRIHCQLNLHKSKIFVLTFFTSTFLAFLPQWNLISLTTKMVAVLKGVLNEGLND